MSAKTWLIIEIIGFSMSFISFVAGVFMFFKMNVLALIGDLTGKTVAREVKKIHESNATNGKKIQKTNVFKEKHMITAEKVYDESNEGMESVNPNYLKNKDLSKGRKTEILDMSEKGLVNDKCNSTTVLSEIDDTEILHKYQQTIVLSDNNFDMEEQKGTTVLNENDEITHKDITPVVFRITKSVIQTHTDEIIR